MSLYAISEAWDKSKAEGATLLLLLAIADYADQQGVSFPSQTHLAQKARIAERSVRRHIERLRDLGELETWEWFDRNRRKRNCYRILVGDYASFRGVEPADIRSKATILRIQLPTATRREVFERDGWACVECGSRELLTIDHIVPVSRGGGNEVENLQTLCRGCNSAKSDRTDCPVEERTGATAPDRTGTSAPARAASLDLEPSVDPIRGRLPKKVDRKDVAPAEGDLAVAVLRAWNEQTGQTLRASEWLSKIVCRIRERPELDLDEHRRVIAGALASPWWSGSPSPSVVYGNGALFERTLDAVRRGVPVGGEDRMRVTPTGAQTATSLLEEAAQLAREGR